MQENSDLTIIYLTTNRLPDAWQKFHREKLLEAVGDTQIISLSVKPIDLGLNIIQDSKLSKSNIFYQMLRGIRLVKTKYIVIVEDDTVYPKDHFALRPPDEQTFIYNQHRWSLYTWNPIYSLKNYIRTNATLIAPTKLALDLLEERFAKYPHDMENIPAGMCGELGIYEKELGLKERKVKDVKSDNPVVQLDHIYFTIHDPKKESIERRKKKPLGKIKALSIPVWGEATELTKYFNEK